LKQPGSIIETKREESREKRIGKKETRSIAGLEIYNGFVQTILRIGMNERI